MVIGNRNQHPCQAALGFPKHIYRQMYPEAFGTWECYEKSLLHACSCFTNSSYTVEGEPSRSGMSLGFPTDRKLDQDAFKGFLKRDVNRLIQEKLVQVGSLLSPLARVHLPSPCSQTLEKIKGLNLERCVHDLPVYRLKLHMELSIQVLLSLSLHLCHSESRQ